jgi:AraC-like DNA-binding protein
MPVLKQRGEDALGSWSLMDWRPRRLSGFAESIWYFEGSLRHLGERHFPNGLAELVVQLGDRFQFVKNGQRQRCSQSCLAGLQTGPTVIEAPPHARVLGIRLFPAGAYAVAGGSLRETTGRVVSLSDLVGSAAAELSESCEAAVSGEERLRCAAKWLSTRIAGSPGVDHRVAWAISRIEGCDGQIMMRGLPEQVGLAKKHFIKVFRAQVGMSPKLYARIVRFRRALQLLHEGTGSLADVALTAGYYDQPHMNLEFRDLGGLSPGDLLAIRRYSPTTALG